MRFGRCRSEASSCGAQHQTETDEYHPPPKPADRRAAHRLPSRRVVESSRQKIIRRPFALCFGLSTHRKWPPRLEGRHGTATQRRVDPDDRAGHHPARADAQPVLPATGAQQHPARGERGTLLSLVLSGPRAGGWLDVRFESTPLRNVSMTLRHPGTLI